LVANRGDAAIGKKRQVVGLPIARHEAFEVVTVPGVLLALEEGANVGFRTWQCGGKNRSEIRAPNERNA